MHVNRLGTLFCEEKQEESGTESWEQHGWPTETRSSRERVRLARNWEETAPALLRRFTEEVLPRWREAARTEALETQVRLLEERVRQLEDSTPFTVPLHTFAPEPYEMIAPICAVVRRVGDEYVASFFDANVSASGVTPEESVRNLKDILIAVFEALSGHDPTALGKEPTEQLEILTRFVGRTA